MSHFQQSNLMRLFSFLILILLTACSSDKSSSKRTISTTKPNTHTYDTHLRDTVTVRGNFILFLCPDDQRFESYTKDPNSGIYEIDGDFGIGIANTLDELSKNKKFNGVQSLVSTKRYILIQDCATCPFMIDRDSIDYGVILSAKNQQIKTIHGAVHGSNFLQEIRAYFNIR